VADGVARGESVPGPTDTHCVLDADKVALEVAQAVEVRSVLMAGLTQVAVVVVITLG
jgi:hypothetical protein